VEKVTCRILGFTKIPDLGQLVKVHIVTNFGVEPPGIINWLQKYGNVSSNYSMLKNETTGLYTDVFETEMVLKRHIHEFLPMYGYLGIPKVCNKCYRDGHMKRDCKNAAREWIKFVIDLMKEAKIPMEMVGTWEGAIKRV